MPTVRIKIPTTEQEFRAAHQFHLDTVGTFLYPRTIDDFRKIRDDYSVLIATNGNEIIGLCYIKVDDNKPNRWEFGGVIVKDTGTYRGSGLASALGTVAISHQHYMERTALPDRRR